MIHWEPSYDGRGFPIWLEYVECGHWGLVLTDTFPRWYYGDSPFLMTPTT